jgi:hypothetical protein
MNMTKDLTAAIARLKADEYELNGLGICEREEDIETIYKTLLDARPITAEGLVAMGFVLNGHRYEKGRLTAEVDAALSTSEGGK